MIKSHKELLFYIKADAIMCEQVFPHSFLKRTFFPSLIESFLRTMRYAEYYGYVSKRNVIFLPVYFFYKKKYEKLNNKTGFDIPLNTFGYGLRIGHLSSLIVNGSTKIGNYCCLANNIVFADGGKKTIGNDVYIGSNCVIAKELTIENGCKISACSFLNTSCIEENMLYGGVIAKPIKKIVPWTMVEPYKSEKARCEALKEKMGLIYL